MKKYVLIAIIAFIVLFESYAQETGIPATTNVPGRQYPRILPDNRVVFQVNAPDAKSLQIDLGKKYDMMKNEEGLLRHF